MKAVQNSHRQRSQRNEKDVREDNPVQLHGLRPVRPPRTERKRLHYRRGNMIPRTVITAATNASVQNSLFAKSQTSSLDFSRIQVVKTGMNDAVIDPSPTSRRNRFGIR